MIKILNLLWVLILGFCVGTVITEALLAAVLAPKLKLNNARVAQIAAIAQGADVAPKEGPKGASPPENEQASYQEIVEARAVKFRNLELREQQLRNNLAQVQLEESKLADDIKRNKQLADSFNAQLEAVRKNATSSGMDDLLRTIVKMQAKQAKEQLIVMLDNKEMDAVVSLIRQMPDKQRANIIGQFKTDEEKEKLAEVLRRLREGQPEMQVVEKAQAKAENKKTP
jgi:hypothetical protein